MDAQLVYIGLAAAFGLFKDFQKVVGTWGTVSEKAYYDILQPTFPLKG